MKRILTLLMLLPMVGHAATIAVTPGSGANVAGVTDGASNFHAQPLVCDATTPTNCAPVSTTTGMTVNGNIGGFNSGTSPVQSATPSGSSYAAGTSVGGLFTVPAARVAGGHGVLTTFSWISSGGDQTQKVLRIWDKNPTSTTCTDNTAFASSLTDDMHLVTPVPLTFTPQPPANTTGDAKTYGGMTGLALSYANQDGTPTVNVYACVVTNGTDTLDHSNAVKLNVFGPQD